MTAVLLDVNVVIALIDPGHEHHDRAHDWFAVARTSGWISCPTTQNGTIRIVSNPKYSNAQPVAVVMRSVESLLRSGDHLFVADSVSLVDASVDRSHLLAASQVTDTYLLALAVSVGARLATFDRRLVTSAVVGGDEAILRIP